MKSGRAVRRNPSRSDRENLQTPFQNEEAFCEGEPNKNSMFLRL